MSVKLPQIIQHSVRWVEIDLQGGQTLRLQVGQPTFSQQVHAMLAESEIQFWERRIQASVIGWDCVVGDDDQPILFSWDGLLALFATYPQMLAHVQTAVLDVWVTFPEDLEKNLPKPPVNGGTTTTAATIALTASSNSSDSSSDAHVPENSLGPKSI
jgi:hypothetical protein